MGRVTGTLKAVKRKRSGGWKDRVYYARYRLPNGKQVQKRIGAAWFGADGPSPPGHYTLKQAEAKLREILVDAQRGALAEPTGVTFAVAADEYLRYIEEVRKRGAKTVSDYRGVIEGYLLDEFGETLIEDVTPDAIDAYKERLIAEGKLSNRTIVRHLTVLHGVFKRAKRKWGLPVNPASADLVERPEVVYSGEFDTLDRDEVELLASVAENAQDAAIYKTAAFTGLRQGELLALRWECVDFVGGLLHVRRNFTGGEEKIPKGKRVRSVPMMPAVIDTLAALKQCGSFPPQGDCVGIHKTVGDGKFIWVLKPH